MAEDSNVRIVEWPKEQDLRLSHGFEDGAPLPVKVGFDGPIDVNVANGKEPLDVAMAMEVSARRPVPLCISLCEPICAKSDYRIDIAIFDQPVANIVVRGLTRLFNCDDESPSTPKQRCSDVNDLKEGQEFPDGLVIENDVKLTPMGGGALRVVSFGDPAATQKLAFPATGVRIDLPQPASQLSLTVNCYAGMSLDFVVFAGSAVAEQRTEPFSNEVKTLIFNRNGMTALEIRGGMNEAAVVQVCWSPEQGKIRG